MAAKRKASTRTKGLPKTSLKISVHLGKLFRDRLFRWYLVAAIGLGLLAILILLARVRAVDYAVPLQYYSPQGFDNLGAWYRAYSYGLLGLITTAGNVLLAALSYDKSRIGSFLLIMGTAVVNLFLLIVIITLTGNLGI